MIITIKGADFSDKNIGTLSTWTILTNLGLGATYSGDRFVDKGGSLSATITIADGYELGSAGVSVKMGTTDVSSSAATVSGNTITIVITKVTGNVTINVPTLTTGGEEIPNYRFTINPTPSNATVTLTASGYTQSGNSITVPNGTAVSWRVSASGYTEQTGSWTINGGNKTENVVLGAVTPNNYTLTINPTPSTATITLTATGYTQNGNSITVANGTAVSWSVSADGYTEQNGTWTANGANKTENVVLVASGGGGEAYWISEKISGKSIGSGKIKSTLNGYLAITDPAYVAELAGKTVEEIAVGLRSAAVVDTVSIKIYLVDLNNPAPSDWVLKDTVSGLGGDASTIKTNVLNTPFVVPSGYTLGYYSMSVMGSGELIEGYTHSDSYYANVSADTSTTMSFGSIDFKVKAYGL